MKRREFVTHLGGLTAAWLFDADTRSWADPIKLIGVLMPFADSNSEVHERLRVFRETLQNLGWMEGRNARFEYRWAGGADRLLPFAKELVALQPDVILTNGSPATAALQAASRTIPIVFASGSDLVGSKLVQSLAHPGGNTTGFTNYEFSFGAKWLEELHEIAPRLKRVCVLTWLGNAGNAGLLRAIEEKASSLSLEVLPGPVRDAREIEAAIEAASRHSDIGLLVLPSAPAQDNAEMIVARADRYRMPAIFPYRKFVAAGGLISDGVEITDLYRRSADYVDRILRGTKPADLPVQQPTKFELLINVKTAKALGVQVPASMLATADEVIE